MEPLRLHCIRLVLVFLVCPAAAVAQSAVGARPVRLDASLEADLMANVDGGLRTDGSGVLLGTLTVEADGAALLGVRGLRAHLTVLGALGDGPSTYVGDIQGPSNIAAPAGIFPFEAWLQQNLAADRLSLLAGLYDVNSEFDVLESAGLFLNSSFGIGPDFALSGDNGPSTFPATGLGFRAAAVVGGSVRLRAAIVDGTPGDPTSAGAFDPWLRPGDGALLVAEVAVGGAPLGGTDPGASERARAERAGRGATGPPSKVAIGAWRYAGRAGAESTCCGVYLLAETRIVTDRDDPARTVAVFGRAGHAPRGQSAVSRYVGLGLTATSPLGRGDELGLGVALAWPDATYLAAAGFPDDRDEPEQVLELSYKARLTDGLFLQPDLQYVAHPAGHPSSEHALLVSLRVGLTR